MPWRVVRYDRLEESETVALGEAGVRVLKEWGRPLTECNVYMTAITQSVPKPAGKPHSRISFIIASSP